MKLDILLQPSNDMRADAAMIQRAEDLGYDAVWSTERHRNPFFALTIAAAATERIQLGVYSAAAFPRSPMVTAQIAWDLASQSGGRFILGLEAAASSHSEATAERDPLGRMREYIESLRAIWRAFQTDARLRYRGEHYTFRLMAPFFNPGPIPFPNVPVFLAGGDRASIALAGQLCQGLHAPALHTVDYLRHTLAPALADGLATAGKDRSYLEVAVPVFVVSGVNEAERARAKQETKRRIALLARSPVYRSIIAPLSWKDMISELDRLAAASHWEKLPNAVTDDALEQAAIVAEPGDVLKCVRDRYLSIADRVCLRMSRIDGKLLELIQRE